MATISEALAIAFTHHQAGRLSAAEQIYRQILAIEPEQADALGALGILAEQSLRHAEAADYFARAIRVNPAVAAYHANLGTAYRGLGRLDDSVACCRRALQRTPNDPSVYYNLGNALKDQGKLDEAAGCYQRSIELRPDDLETCLGLALTRKLQGNLEQAVAGYRAALRIKPDWAPAHNNLGDALHGLGKIEEAMGCYRRAIELDPDFAGAYNNLGNAQGALGRRDEAVASLRRALSIEPDFAAAHNNLAVVLHDQGRIDEAIRCCRRALELQADFADAYYNLANALSTQGDLGQAESCYRRAIQIRPDYAAAYDNLGAALQEQGRLDEAVDCHRHALRLRPGLAEALNNLGVALKNQGNLDEALQCFRQAWQSRDDGVKAHSNWLLGLQYQPEATLAGLAAAHAEWDGRHAASLRATWRPQANRRDPQRRLRLGLVSADFGRHPVGFFLVRALESLRATDVEIFCYSTRPDDDPLTARIQAAATAWRPVRWCGDEELAGQIRNDAIDILFDLAGHTAGNRLLLFARKPAPVQITWLGYAGTTGLAAMDYILADRYQIPPEAEVHYRERVLRMPEGYACYDPPGDAPAVSGLPAAERGYVTFGAMHNPAKISLPVVQLWARILHRVPGSRLALKFKGFDQPSVARRYAELFAAEGISRERLDFVGWSEHPQSLAHYRQIDLALDTFPYSGGLTTCESLWMGVPVVTCAGETFASRHSLSHLSNAGLTETIARDREHYQELAVALAGDLPRLAEIRGRLRGQMAAAPLCDGPRFARNFAALLRDVWRAWVASPT
jgi:predicted O-linked N-acetylglucosamine transferase (SPINDLY family)